MYPLTLPLEMLYVRVSSNRQPDRLETPENSLNAATVFIGLTYGHVCETLPWLSLLTWDSPAH